jgi:hypothetical protein
MDVSRAGLFVQAEELPSPGSAVTLQFRSPAGALVDLRGQVHWNTESLADPDVPSGFGIRLCEPPREYRAFFRWVLSQLKNDEGDASPVL